MLLQTERAADAALFFWGWRAAGSAHQQHRHVQHLDRLVAAWLRQFGAERQHLGSQRRDDHRQVAAAVRRHEVINAMVHRRDGRHDPGPGPPGLKRALQTHPDKTQGDRRAFDKVAEAHDVLSDETKRSLFDRYGKKGIDRPPSSHRSTTMTEELFRSMFGHGATAVPRNKNVKYQLEVTLEDLYSGLTRAILVEQTIFCRSPYSEILAITEFRFMVGFCTE